MKWYRKLSFIALICIAFSSPKFYEAAWLGTYITVLITCCMLACGIFPSNSYFKDIEIIDIAICGGFGGLLVYNIFG